MTARTDRVPSLLAWLRSTLRRCARPERAPAHDRAAAVPHLLARPPAATAACVLAVGLLAAPPPASAAEPSGPATPEEFVPVGDEYVGADGLTGDAIYDRILDNRFDTFEQRLALVSGGPGGRAASPVRLRVRYKSYRDEPGSILSKTIAKYFEPQDVRHLGYLVINKESGPDDQFVYRPSARNVRRVNVRGEAVAGTDFSFEDIVPAEFEDATHHRMPDATVAGRPVFVVTVVPRPETESEYAKLVLYVDKEHFVPLRTDYWDNKRVRVKRLDADPGSIEVHTTGGDGEQKEKKVHVAMQSRMTHLRLDSFTELTIEALEASPDLGRRHFSQRELTASR